MTMSSRAAMADILESATGAELLGFCELEVGDRSMELFFLQGTELGVDSSWTLDTSILQGAGL